MIDELNYIVIDEQDPDGLLTDIKHKCEDCGKKIKPDFKKCYNCYMEDKNDI